MNLKDRQIILYYLKNAIQNGFEPEDYDIFFHNLARNSIELFGFNFREAVDCMEKRLSSEGKEYFLKGILNGKIDFHEFIQDEKVAAEYQKLAESGAQNVDITTPDFDQNFHIICDAFDLPKYCRPVLQFFVSFSKVPVLRRIINNFVGISYSEIMDEDNEDFVAGICQVPLIDVKRSTSQNGPLFDAGIMAKTYTDKTLTNVFKKLLSMHFNSPREVRNELLGVPLETDLTSDNFDYMAQDYQCLKNVLESAIKNDTIGVNILLYGKPGCGKTELAKSICAASGLCLYATSSSSEEKDARLGNLAQVQTVLKQDKDSVILFDESEDVFSLWPFSKNTPSKLYINRRLENNKRPVIWITNKIADMDRAYVRRFTLALKVTDPDEKAKITAWRRVFDKYKLAISDANLSKLVKKYNVSMALVDTAVKNAKMLGDDKMLEYTLDNMIGAMTGVVPGNKNKLDVEFDTKLLNTDQDLEKLANQICNKNITRFSLCLYGAPGTGKTAFAKYLGEKLGLNVICKRASDILGPYVGETEHNIAAAFAEARSKKALLIFDEADSFLQSRDKAMRSWEVTCVNEMLTQMENAEYPFVCTTNLMNDLDKAALRRFSFKVKYDYLTQPQVIRAFKLFFKQDVTPDKVRGLTNLTPGDFSVVKKQADLMDITNADDLLKMLTEEQKVKNVTRNKIGF